MALFIPFGLIGLIGSSLLLYTVDDVRARPRLWFTKLAITIMAVFGVTLWALQAKPMG